jgi:hypothetical protein
MKKLLVAVGVLSMAGAAFAGCNSCGCSATEVDRQVIKAEKPCCVKMVEQYHQPKKHVQIVEEESWSCPTDTKVKMK